MAFDDDSILGNWKVTDGGRKDRLNRATVTFINKNKSYKEDSVSWPKLDSASYTTLLAEDSGEKLHQTFDVASIPDYYQAEDWAEFQVRNSRSNRRVTVDLAPKAMVLEYGDVISLTSSARDYTAKWFRVRKVTLKVDGTVTVDLVEYDATIYSWSSKTVEPLDDPGEAPFVWDDPIALVGLNATGFHNTKVDGSVVSGFDVAWTAPTDTVELDFIEVAWRVFGAAEYTNVSRVESGSSSVRIEPLVDNTGYDIRVTYRTNLGQISVEADIINHYLGDAVSRLSGIEDGATQTNNEAVVFGGNNNLFSNGQFRLLAADGRPAGLRRHGSSAAGSITQAFDADGNAILRIVHVSDTSLQLGLALFALNSKSKYNVRLEYRCQDNGGDTGNAASGFYIIMNESTTIAPDIMVIGAATLENTTDMVTFDTRVFGLSDQPVTTSWQTLDWEYVPNSGAVAASLGISNWTGLGLRALDIRNVVITEIAPQNVYELDSATFDSNLRFIDNERMPMLRNYGLGTSRTANPLTASDAGATATVSVAAHTVYNGDSTGKTYNAGSITGLAFSTGYTIYADDPDYDGGTVTYVATTTGVNAGKNLGRYFIGTVTTPADGGGAIGGGGGGGFDCIAAHMWLTDNLQAKDLNPSSTLIFLTEIEGVANGDSYYQDQLESVDFSKQLCVEIETTGGAKLICSVSTPVTLRSGALIPVTECLGGELATLINGEFEWQEVKRLDYVGEWLVAHIHAGGRTFAAGAEARAKIFTHNALKP